MLFLDVGFGNLVCVDRIVYILNTSSAPAKRMISKAKENNLLVDATCRRPSQSAIITDNGQICLSYLKPKTLSAKIPENGQQPEDI